MLYHIPISPLEMEFCGRPDFIPVTHCRPFRRPCHGSVHRPMLSRTVLSNGPRRGEFHLVQPFVQDVNNLWKTLAAVPLSNPEGEAHGPVWKETVNFNGFDPERVELKISGDKLILEAVHETSDGDSYSEVRQMKRNIVIPKGVNREEITATLTPNGFLQISGPRQPANKLENKHEHSEKNTCTSKVSYENARTSEKGQEDSKTTEEDNKTAPSQEATDNSMSEDTAAKEGMAEGADTIDEDIAGKREITEREDNVVDDITNKGNIPETAEPQKDEDHLGSSHSKSNDTDKVSMETNDINTLAEKRDKPFTIEVDMSKFNPDSIEVKLKESSLTVVGRQDEKDESDNVVKTQLLCRSFFIPSNVNSDLMTSQLDSKGLLTVAAPYKTKSADRIIPVAIY